MTKIGVIGFIILVLIFLGCQAFVYFWIKWTDEYEKRDRIGRENRKKRKDK